MGRAVRQRPGGQADGQGCSVQDPEQSGLPGPDPAQGNQLRRRARVHRDPGAMGRRATSVDGHASRCEPGPDSQRASGAAQGLDLHGGRASDDAAFDQGKRRPAVSVLPVDPRCPGRVRCVRRQNAAGGRGRGSRDGAVARHIARAGNDRPGLAGGHQEQRHPGHDRNAGRRGAVPHRHRVGEPVPAGAAPHRAVAGRAGHCVAAGNAGAAASQRHRALCTGRGGHRRCEIRTGRGEVLA